MSEKQFYKLTAAVGAAVLGETPRKQPPQQPPQPLKLAKINGLVKSAAVAAAQRFGNRRKTEPPQPEIC
jgi:hypothetical protein